MAAVQGQIAEILAGGINDKRRSTIANSVSNTSLLVTPANLHDMNSIEAALLALSGPVYTQLTLNQMNLNDKIYAYRKLVDGGSI